MTLLTLKEINLITGICISSLRTYLKGYRFDKFRYRNKYIYDKDFIKVLVDFLYLKRKREVAEEIEKKLLSGK